MLPDDYWTFLKKLISTKSLSCEEGDVASIIESEMKLLGYDDVFIDKIGNVIGIIDKGDGPVVCLNGHMDHVPEGSLENWKTPPYKPTVIDGKLYGRATVDMKGALAAMIYAAAKAKKLDDIHGKIVVTAVVQEELQEGLGMQYIVEHEKMNFDAVILGEATNLNLAIGHRGRGELIIRVYGKTSHASMPELGDNAIYHAVPIIEEIMEFQQELPEHQKLGKGTVAVTAIRAYPGEGPIIPDKVELNVDRRMILGVTQKDLVQQLESIISRAKRKDSNISAEVELITLNTRSYTGYEMEVTRFFPTWLMDEQHSIVVKAKYALSEVLGHEPNLITWRFSTDGAYTNGVAKIPTIGFGPGDESLAHQPNEYVPLEHLKVAYNGYVSLIKTLTTYT